MWVVWDVSSSKASLGLRPHQVEAAWAWLSPDLVVGRSVSVRIGRSISKVVTDPERLWSFLMADVLETVKYEGSCQATWTYMGQIVGWWFKICCISSPTCGSDSAGVRLFRRVGTTNQMYIEQNSWGIDTACNPGLGWSCLSICLLTQVG